MVSVMTTIARRPIARRHVRTMQRGAHLLAGAALLALVYVGPNLGPGFHAVIQWVITPVLIASGIALWKWPRIRAAFRGKR